MVKIKSFPKGDEFDNRLVQIYTDHGCMFNGYMTDDEEKETLTVLATLATTFEIVAVTTKFCQRKYNQNKFFKWCKDKGHDRPSTKFRMFITQLTLNVPTKKEEEKSVLVNEGQQTELELSIGDSDNE
jgi:hypothetical protein